MLAIDPSEVSARRLESITGLLAAVACMSRRKSEKMTMAEVAINNLASSILSGLLALFIVLGLFNVARIKDHGTKFFLLFAPLLRSFFILIDAPSASFKRRAFAALLVRFPDPFGWLSMKFPEIGGFFFSFDLYRTMILLAALIIAVTMTVRWVRLFALRVSLSHGPSLSREEYRGVTEMVDYLSHRMGVRPPRLVMATDGSPAPFTIGAFRPVIVLSASLLDGFQGRKLEAILAHEIAHIRRFDSITRWFVVVLKDLQFFNPVASLIYRHLEVERELVCDLTAAESIGISPRYFADILVDYVEFNRSLRDDQYGKIVPVLAFQPNLSACKTKVFSFDPLKKRIEVLRSSDEFPSKPTLFTFAWAGLVFLWIVWIQFGLYIKAWGLNMFIR